MFVSNCFIPELLMHFGFYNSKIHKKPNKIQTISKHKNQQREPKLASQHETAKWKRSNKKSEARSGRPGKARRRMERETFWRFSSVEHLAGHTRSSSSSLSCSSTVSSSTLKAAAMGKAAPFFPRFFSVRLSILRCVFVGISMLAFTARFWH